MDSILNIKVARLTSSQIHVPDGVDVMNESLNLMIRLKRNREGQVMGRLNMTLCGLCSVALNIGLLVTNLYESDK